jgi:hypothetical protein
MKMTIKQDNTVECEGSPEELARFRNNLLLFNGVIGLDTIPSTTPSKPIDWTTIKGCNNPACPKHNGAAWYWTVPPTCISGL